LIYLFRCERHGTFDVRQSIFDKHEADCPECGLPGQRIFTSVPFQFGKADYNKDGSRDLNPNLPHVPTGTKYTHGWNKDKGGVEGGV